MDEDNLNIEIRKFLKKVGITSQREIENYIRKKFSEGSLKEGQTIEISMVCLLYTSPSPRDGLLSRMPSSA